MRVVPVMIVDEYFGLHRQTGNGVCDNAPETVQRFLNIVKQRFAGVIPILVKITRGDYLVGTHLEGDFAAVLEIGEIVLSGTGDGVPVSTFCNPAIHILEIPVVLAVAGVGKIVANVVPPTVVRMQFVHGFPGIPRRVEHLGAAM